MLPTISMEEAQATLPDIISKLGPGEEVVITKDDQPVAKLQSPAAGKPQPRFGSCQGHADHCDRRRGTSGGLQRVYAMRMLLDTHAYPVTRIW